MTALEQECPPPVLRTLAGILYHYMLLILFKVLFVPLRLF
jgi:hypothetical protein